MNYLYSTFIAMTLSDSFETLMTINEMRIYQKGYSNLVVEENPGKSFANRRQTPVYIIQHTKSNTNPKLLKCLTRHVTKRYSNDAKVGKLHLWGLCQKNKRDNLCLH